VDINKERAVRVSDAAGFYSKMIDLDAIENMLVEVLYGLDALDLEHDALNLNINGWLTDVECGDATINEVLENIVLDIEQRESLKERIEFVDGFEGFDIFYENREADNETKV
jgi:hypothetical protein